MITGKVSHSLALEAHLSIRNADGKTREIEVALDSGFNGSLALPRSLVEELSLPTRNIRSNVMLADGAEASFDVYAATITWDGAPRRVLVEAAGPTALVGMSLLEGYDLHAHMIPGGMVCLNKLPSL